MSAKTVTCIQITCDVCDTEYDLEGEGYTQHFHDLPEAVKFLADDEWKIRSDGYAICPADDEEHRAALAELEPTAPVEQIPGQTALSVEPGPASASDVGAFEQLTAAPLGAGDPQDATESHLSRPDAPSASSEPNEGTERPQETAGDVTPDHFADELCAHCAKPLGDSRFGIYFGAKVCHTGTVPPTDEPADCYRLLSVYGEDLGCRISSTPKAPSEVAIGDAVWSGGRWFTVAAISPFDGFVRFTDARGETATWAVAQSVYVRDRLEHAERLAGGE